MASRKWLPDSAGMTLVEVILVVAIIGTIMVPLYDTFLQGWFMERRASQQEQARITANKIIIAIIEGTPDVPGLRQGQSASVVYADDFQTCAYQVEEQWITYFLQGSQLMKTEHPYIAQVEPDYSDASVLAAGVRSFQVMPDPDYPGLIAITIDTGEPGLEGNAQALLTTKVRPRN